MIKILLVTTEQTTGLNYHRQLVPHKNLVNNYEDYSVDLIYNFHELTDEQIKEYQIVSFLRLVDHQFKTKEIIDRCKGLGCKVVVDIDDYWVLHNTHGLKVSYNENKIPEQTIVGLVNADWVTTTTEHFADKIREYNSNVTVLPNSIDPTEEQFKPKPNYSDRLRLGWIGGVYHSEDIAMLSNGFKDVWKSIHPDKFQLCLGGFNPNQAYNYLESVFTAGYTYPKDKDYKKYLSEPTQENSHLMDSQPYKRLWGTSAFKYAELYNDIDVALVPLCPNGFNSYKSQIKIIEAGWFKKAVVVSNVMPYTIDCTRNNSMLVSPSKRNEGWGVAMKSLILNPERVKDLAEAMHETVKDKYLMDNVNIVRDQLYKHITK